MVQHLVISLKLVYWVLLIKLCSLLTIFSFSLSSWILQSLDSSFSFFLVKFISFFFALFIHIRNPKENQLFSRDFLLLISSRTFVTVSLFYAPALFKIDFRYFPVRGGALLIKLNGNLVIFYVSLWENNLTEALLNSTKITQTWTI